MSRNRVVNLANFNQFTAINLLADPGHDPVLKPIPQAMEVRFDYLLNGGRVAHNVTHARYGASYPGTTALANSLKAAWVALFSSAGLTTAISTSTQVTAVSLRDLAVLNSPYVVSDSASSTIGGDAGSALPDETAVVLTLRTAISGPGGRGRIYLGGFGVSALGPSNVIVGTVATALTTFANGVRGVYSAQTLTMCLALPSRVAYTGSTGRQHPARIAQTADVTSVTLRNNTWDSQRRRGFK